MSQYDFGAAFVLKSRPDLSKDKKKTDLIEGIFRVCISDRVFHFIRKCAIAHTIPFDELHSIRVDPMNILCIHLVFKQEAPAEIHAQSGQERSSIEQMLDCIAQQQPVQSDVLSRSDHTVKRGWCTKKGKMMSPKRQLVLNKRGTLTLFKNDASGALPSYIILLHHKVVINPQKTKEIQIISSFKAFTFSFANMEEREEWFADLRKCTIPDPKPPIPPLESPHQLGIGKVARV